MNFIITRGGLCNRLRTLLSWNIISLKKKIYM